MTADAAARIARTRPVPLASSCALMVGWTALVHFEVRPFFPIAAVFCALWIAVSAAAMGGSIRAQLRTTLTEVALGIAIGTLLFIGTRATLWALCFGSTPSLCEESTRIFATFGPPTVLHTLILVALIGPAEEFFWRGAVLRALRERTGRWSALALMSVGCSGVLLIFGEPLLALAAFPTSLVWGFLADARGGLAPAIASHSTWQLLIFGLLVSAAGRPPQLNRSGANCSQFCQGVGWFMGTCGDRML